MSEQPDPEMLANLDMLLNLDLIESEEAWDGVGEPSENDDEDLEDEFNDEA